APRAERCHWPGESRRPSQLLSVEDFGRGVVFWTCMRNSTFEPVSLNLDMSSSTACCCSRPDSSRRSCHITFVSSEVMSISSRRVLEALTSMAGKMRLSASWRLRRSSILPVPLNSSKMTSSIFDPVSTSAVARMVSEPPPSISRAAPKNFFGGYRALAATGEDAAGGRLGDVVGTPEAGDVVQQDDDVRAHLDQTLGALDGELGDRRVVVGRAVEGRRDDLALDGTLHVRDFLGTFVDED